MKSYLLAALAAFLVMFSGQVRADPVHVMAAFTFKSALDDAVQVYKSDGGADVVPQYGMTPMLAKQVENLAPADIFLSADASWLNYLAEHDLIQSASRVDLLTADLVLVTRADNTDAPTNSAVGRDYPLDKIIGSGRVAMCNPVDDPAGKLGRASLEALGLWPSIADKIAITESPPAAVALVLRGEAPMALVFSTDAVGIPGIKVAGVFPRDSHPPIVFPAALLRGSRNPAAPFFLSFLQSPKAAAIFERYGYRPLTGTH
jgi:molybdate transport system substrate-binding protein